MTKFEVFVRHGEYGGAGGNLAQAGITQAEVIANYITLYTSVVSADGVLVLCGQSRRAIETARIIGKQLGLEPEETIYLGGKDGNPTQESWMFDGMRPFFDADHDLMICVTHSQQAIALAKRARGEMFPDGGGPDIYGLEMGRAFIVDRQNMTIFQYPQ